MQRSGKALQTIADKEEMNFEGSLKYYFCTSFLAKFETKKKKKKCFALPFVEDMTRAKKMAKSFRVTVFSEVYEFVFDDCMKTVEHSKSTFSKSGPRTHFEVLSIKTFQCRFEQF